MVPYSIWKKYGDISRGGGAVRLALHGGSGVLYPIYGQSRELYLQLGKRDAIPYMKGAGRPILHGGRIINVIRKQ